MQNAIDCMLKTYTREYERYKAQKKRLKQFIKNELSKGHIIYFSTFTFKEEYINIETDKKIRQIFTKYLNRNGLKCKLYADYGSTTDRFHLHGFFSTDRKNLSNQFNRFGWTKFIKLEDVEDLNKAINYTICYATKKSTYYFKPISINPSIRK